MTFDAMQHCTPEPRPRDPEVPWYTLQADTIYPAVIARILVVLEEGKLPDELVDNASQPEVDPRGVARMYFTRAKNVPIEAWGWALQPREDFSEADEIAARAEALEVARLWFTQALHVQVGGDGHPLGVHWVGPKSWRK